jgi:hypothetical protein
VERKIRNVDPALTGRNSLTLEFFVNQRSKDGDKRYLLVEVSSYKIN